jgi:hypothetical protein
MRLFIADLCTYVTNEEPTKHVVDWPDQPVMKVQRVCVCVCVSVCVCVGTSGVSIGLGMVWVVLKASVWGCGRQRLSDFYGTALELVTVLIGYRDVFRSLAEAEMLVACLERSLTKWAARPTRTCLHAFAVCALESPALVRRHISPLCTRLAQAASNPALAVPLAETLLMLVRAPDVATDFVEADYKRVLSVAIQFLVASVHAPPPAAADAPAPSASVAATAAVAAYVRLLASQVLCVAFLGMRPAERPKYVPYIARGLLALDAPSAGASTTTSNRNSNNNTGTGTGTGTARLPQRTPLEEQREILLDLLARYAYADCQPRAARCVAPCAHNA